MSMENRGRMGLVLRTAVCRKRIDCLCFLCQYGFGLGAIFLRVISF